MVTCPTCGEDEELSAEQLDDGRRRITCGSCGEIWVRGEARVVYRSVHSVADTFAQFRARWLANDPESFAAINRMLCNGDISEELRQIKCPTLVTAGRHDSLRPTSAIEPMSKRIPGAQFLELNSGHFASIQTPGIMAQADRKSTRLNSSH